MPDTRSAGLKSESLLPDTLLPLAKIRDYLGSELTALVADLEPGEIAPPVAVGGAYHIVYLVAFEPGVLPDFDDAHSLLESEQLRRDSDEALRKYLLWLREQSDVEVAWERVQQP